MPKRKERPTDIPDQRPTSKLRKKDSTRDRSKHGKRKVPRPASSAEPRQPQKKLNGVSSNWKTLSKSLGISCERKQSMKSSSGGNGRKGAEGKSGGGGGAEKEVWFDDIPLECVDGDLVPKPPEHETRSVSLVAGNDKSAGRYVALDCEMVGTGPGGSFSMVACVCLVNHHGNVLLDTFVAPMDRVTDYRTAISGVSAKDLRGAPEFKSVQKQVSDILEDRILVGHSLQNDLKALLLSHPKRNTRDTSKYRPFKKIAQV
ncbi:RNA exonuclease 4 [Geodia barretti]|uniref:RNA exonuclease 4 n=1 Tax=Geodia barretti TaxID=519541 RepID=A0AA35SPR6_GEOBA|nr:RNA exonuclease 4 [Geodia barretti]